MHSLGDLDGAMKLLNEEETICWKLGNKYNLQRCIGNKAAVFRTMRDFSRSLGCLEAQEIICREIGAKEGLAISLMNQAGFSFAMNDLQKALLQAEEAYQITQLSGMDLLSKEIEELLNTIRAEIT